MQAISYTKIILSVGMIVFVAAMVVAGTGAFFSDTETSTGNVFAAGALDLKVDSVAHYNGLICFDSGDDFSDGLVWHPANTLQWNPTDEVYEIVPGTDLNAEITAYNDANPAANPGAGENCVSTWSLADLGPQTFFNFADLKPGDNGENTISLHVESNDAYACVVIDDMVDGENGITEPEEDVDETAEVGELSQELRFFAWADDGDNVWEDGEQVLFSNTEGPASDVIDGVVYPLFTPDTGVLPGADTEYVGLYWCYGALGVDVGTNTLTCDGSTVTNLTQTDSLTTSLTFYVEQARNNENFECPALEDVEPDSDRASVGAVLGAYTAPATDSCDLTVDGDGADPDTFATIQEAVDAATDGETICVEGGTYTEDVSVDESVRIAALTNPESGTPALLFGQFTVLVDEVTIEGMKITNIAGSGEREGIFVGNSAGFTDLAGLVTLQYNLIDGVETDVDKTVEGIHVKHYDGIDPIDGMLIANNVIKNVEEDGSGANGMKLQSDVRNIDVEYNTIADVTGVWAYGITATPATAETGNPTGVTIVRNDINDVVGTTYPAVAVGVDETSGGADNGDASGLTVTENNLDSVALGVINKDSSAVLSAENNWWGDLDPSDNVAAPNGGPGVDFDPFEVAAFPLN